MDTQADNVEKHFFRYLSEKRFSIGDTLPRELEISEHMQVSRHIVREGISRLKAYGLVEARKRRGTVICRPKPFLGFEKILAAGLYDEEDCQYYMELRTAIELGMCDFIFARRTKEKIERLKKTAGIAQNGQYELDTEMDFHTCLMAIAENPAADDFRRILLLAMKKGVYSGNIPKTDMEKAVSHEQICEVLEFGDAASFREIMRTHLKPYYKHLISKG